MLIVLEAHALSDGDLLTVAGYRARRCVLFGESSEVVETANGEVRQSAETNGSAPTGPSSQSAFNRLWHLLHSDPWGREGERVVLPIASRHAGRLTRPVDL